MKIERGEDPGLVCVKGYPETVLRVREFQADLTSDNFTKRMISDLRYAWGPPPLPLAAICEVVVGESPNHWETCNLYGQYRVNVKNLRKATPLELLALCAE